MSLPHEALPNSGGSLTERMNRLRAKRLEDGDVEPPHEAQASPSPFRPRILQKGASANDMPVGARAWTAKQSSATVDVLTDGVETVTQVVPSESKSVEAAHVHEPARDDDFSTKSDLLTLLIPILDDLDDALTHVPEPLWGDSWVAGVLLVGDRVQELLQKSGVDRIFPLHEPFNPRYHEAISRLEGDALPENVAHNSVTSVYRPGYICNGKVLRAAQVQVAVRKGK